MSVPLPPRPPAQHYTNTGIGSTLGSLAGGPIGAVAGTLAETLLASAFADKGPGFREQLNTARTAQHKQIMGHFASTMKAAEVNKIHPLVALGISPSSGGFSLSQDVSSGMGQNIGRAVRSAFSGSRQEQELADLAVERAHLENDLLRSQISNINYQPGDPRVISKPDEETMKRRDDSGLGAALPPGFREYDMGHNQKIELPFSEEGPSEAIENLPFPIKQYKAFELFYKRNYPNTPSGLAQRWTEYMQRQRTGKTSLIDKKFKEFFSRFERKK